eukprot:UN17901
MEMKTCAKEVVIGPDLHQKYYRNRMIFQKCTTFSNSLIFFFDLTVDFKVEFFSEYIFEIIHSDSPCCESCKIMPIDKILSSNFQYPVAQNHGRGRAPTQH